MVEILNISEEKNKKKVARDLLFTSAPISIHLLLTGIQPPIGPILEIGKDMQKERKNPVLADFKTASCKLNPMTIWFDIEQAAKELLIDENIGTNKKYLKCPWVPSVLPCYIKTRDDLVG